MKKWFTIKALAPSAGSIEIYDEIGAFGIGAGEFSAALKALGTVSRITVSINSPGGEVFAGLSIYNMLKRHPAHITARVDGVAASIASVIAMAGDETIMPENAMMMIYNPAGGVLGSSEDMREMADALDKISGSLVSSYASKTGLAREKIEAIMAAETWLTAAEAVDLGFADKMRSQSRSPRISICRPDMARRRRIIARKNGSASPTSLRPVR